MSRRIPTQKQIYESNHEPVSVARRIVGEFVDLRNAIKSTAEGFAVLDFVQGHVATELPTSMARDIVAVLRGNAPAEPNGYIDDLVLFWLENYRRAFSHMVMRVLEDGADSLTA